MIRSPSESQLCRGCAQTKPGTDFYPYQPGECKACTCARVRKNRADKIEQYRAFDRARYKRPERRAYTDGRSVGYIATHPKARAAHSAVGNALRDRRLVKQPCEVCGGKVAVHAHHDDYDKPLAVRWLCVPHHSAWHQKNGPGANHG